MHLSHSVWSSTTYLLPSAEKAMLFVSMFSVYVQCEPLSPIISCLVTHVLYHHPT